MTVLGLKEVTVVSKCKTMTLGARTKRGNSGGRVQEFSWKEAGEG